MKELWNEDNDSSDDPYKKSTRAHRRRKSRIVLFGGFVAVIAAGIWLAAHFTLFSPEKQSDTPLPASIGKSSIDESSWSLLLVNKWNSIPEGYVMELTELANGQSVDERIYTALQSMFDAAREDNIYPVVASGYRTAEKQQSLMDEKIAEYKAEGLSDEEAKDKAESWVAIPGTSEHQLGLGVDINADGIHSTGEEVYEWLDKNSSRFGFICRYPADKTEITGVINEPWHYRYVGIEAAEEIHSQGVCLEEYLGKTNRTGAAS